MSTDEGAFFLDEFFRFDAVRDRCSTARAGLTQKTAACALEHLVPGPADRRYDILGCGGEHILYGCLFLALWQVIFATSPCFGLLHSTVDSMFVSPEEGSSICQHGDTTRLEEAYMKTAVGGIV